MNQIYNIILYLKNVMTSEKANYQVRTRHMADTLQVV